MELPDDLFTPITDFISDEHVPTSTNLDKLTDNHDFAMSPITRTLIEVCLLYTSDAADDP